MSVYAQEYGYFFNSSNSDRRYNAESFETWLKPFFVSGVFTGGLQVQAQDTPDMTVKVTAGYANLDGKPARWPSDNNVTIQPASGVYDRIDTIVLRRNNTDRTISIEVVTGTASLNPTPTPPTRNGDIFELVIAQIRVEMGVTEILGSRITDTRPDTDLCGYVVAAVQTPDFSELFEQFESQAEEFFDTQSEEFMTWFDAMKDQLSEDAAGHLQEEIDDLSGEVDGAVKISAQSFSDAEKAQARENIGAESEQIEDDVAIVVRGNKTSHAGGATIGLYVILRQSTIAGCTDGIYKAAKVIPYDTVIDNTYLTPVDGGVANGIQNDIGAKVADMSESLSSAIGIVVKGNKTTYTSGAAAGQFVILQESTIAGCADGLYVAAQAIPYNTAIDSTYLTACPEGGLNALNASLTKYESITHTVSSGFSLKSWGFVAAHIHNNMLFVNISGLVSSNSRSSSTEAIVLNTKYGPSGLVSMLCPGFEDDDGVCILETGINDSDNVVIKVNHCAANKNIFGNIIIPLR